MPIPQTPSELILGQLDWAHKNILNNLDFVPADKLDWKPAPTAKSVLEIVAHFCGTVHMFTSLLQGKEPGELPTATDAAEAKTLVSQVIAAHQSAVRALTPEEGADIVSTPLGELPKAMIAGLPVVELVNHHGQITYIQTLLGDSESHLIVA